MLVTAPIDYFCDEFFIDEKLTNYDNNEMLPFLKNKTLKLKLLNADDIISLGFTLISESKNAMFFEKHLFNNKEIPITIQLSMLKTPDSVRVINVQKNENYVLFEYELVTKKELTQVLKSLRCL